MQDLLWLVILLPLASSFVLAVFGAGLPKKTVGIIACGSIALAWLVGMVVMLSLGTQIHHTPTTTAFGWINTGGLNIDFGLRLDALSAVMLFVVTFVAALIHLYAAQSMLDENGYSRFFSYMNLFVASMLILVLADNLLLLYLGWEGVGLCSYLLIGFWYKETKNGVAAQKAFIVTRIGDTALAIGMFILFWSLGTLNIQEIIARAPEVWTAGSITATLVALLIIGGAVGKSGQIPLHTWLPDAMAGPTPVSALIHAATMVTAGVYLIARLNPLFTLSGYALTVVSVIGAATLLYAGFCAIVQTDIKRVLAYSTISQIGYMFVALGVGAWGAAIFHLMTHAFFKALLFLSAGIVVDALHHEHNIFKMGGLKKKLPVAYWTFLIGACSLSALPLVTAGFYSKDAIIYATWVSKYGSVWLWTAAIAGAFITAIYSFRVFWLVFEVKAEHHIEKLPGRMMKSVVSVLAVFAIVAGFIGMPKVLGGFEPFEHFVSHAFSGYTETGIQHSQSLQLVSMLVSSSAVVLGILVAGLYIKRQRFAKLVEGSPALRLLYSFLLSGMGFDALYNALLVKPFHRLATANAGDILDLIPTSFASMAVYFGRVFSRLQTGKVRDYATGIALGLLILCTMMLLRHLY